MTNKNKYIYSCLLCANSTGTLHEVFFGNGIRDVAIKYNLQVPLCPGCHNMAHGRKIETIGPFSKMTQEDFKKYFCEYLLIDYGRTLLAINTKRTEYLETIKNIAKDQIMARIF